MKTLSEFYLADKSFIVVPIKCSNAYSLLKGFPVTWVLVTTFCQLYIPQNFLSGECVNTCKIISIIATWLIRFFLWSSVITYLYLNADEMKNDSCEKPRFCTHYLIIITCIFAYSNHCSLVRIVLPPWATSCPEQENGRKQYNVFYIYIFRL